MTSLFDLLSQRQPTLQTRKGLILTGLQNDFLSPDGKLPVSSSSDYIDRIKALVPAFRDYGDVIWVRSQYEADRVVKTGLYEAGDSVITGQIDDVAGLDEQLDDYKGGHSPAPVNEASQESNGAADMVEELPPSTASTCSDVDEELFLINNAWREACCMEGTQGAEFATQIRDSIGPKDLQVVKSYYSAFGSTSLLLTLRSKLITELFIGGNLTNLSVFATAVDAARYGIKITLLEDCLGYRNKSRHDAAIKTLKEIMGAEVVTSAQAIEALKNPPTEEPADDEDDMASEVDGAEDGEIAVDGGDEEAAVGGDESIDIDSDEDDDQDEIFSIVGQTLASASRLPSRVAPSMAKIASLRDRPPGQERTTPPREPKNKATTPGRIYDGTGQATTESVVRSDQKPLEHVTERTDDRGASGVVNTDDSSHKVSIKASLSSLQSSKSISAELSKTLHDSNGQPVHTTHPAFDTIATLVGLDQRTADQYDAMMEAFKDTGTDGEDEFQSRPLFGADKEQESAGSRILFDLLPSEIAETIFDQLKEEVEWQTMHHQTGEVPRFVCCQGTIGEDGSMPVYRHPSDRTLPITSWAPTVDKIRKAAEEAVGHNLNHALIQLYRGGRDFISEHSDKTLDIEKGSFIVNVSFGAQRTMRLRTKRGATAAAADGTSPARTTYRVPMPPNSMITMSLPTNAEYLHGIMADKRPRVELSDAETAYEGQRISLTFRNIATFLKKDSTQIWGQGATGKTMEDAKPVISGDAAESERMVRAFGAENQASSIDWNATYGGGFDVLHLR